MIFQAIKKNNVSMSRTTLEKISQLTKFIIRSFLVGVFIILLILFVLMFIYFADSIYNVKNGKETTPLFGTYIIVTESMIPTINVNDAIIVKRVENEDIDIGDIITFSSSDKYYFGMTITHRVVGKRWLGSGEYIYRTKGDNNSLEDTALVELNDIYGKVVLKLPKIGYIQKFVASPFGFIISIIIPVLLVIIYEVCRIRKIIRKRDEEIEIL